MRPGLRFRRLGLALMALALANAAEAKPAAVAVQFGWMVGSWVRTSKAETVRETWEVSGPQTLLGIGRTERLGRPTFEERMTIHTTSAGATFTAELPGQPPTTFDMRAGRPGVAMFENKAHDFPQRVIYRRCGQDLCARIEGVMDGKVASESWRYRRVR